LRRAGIRRLPGRLGGAGGRRAAGRPAALRDDLDDRARGRADRRADRLAAGPSRARRPARDRGRARPAAGRPGRRRPARRGPGEPHAGLRHRPRMRVHVLERSQRLPRAPEDVFGFFADALNLQAITPAWLHFSVLTPDVTMAPGTLLAYRLRLHGLPLR